MPCDVQHVLYVITCNQYGKCYIRPNRYSPKLHSHARCFGACYHGKILNICVSFSIDKFIQFEKESFNEFWIQKCTYTNVFKCCITVLYLFLAYNDVYVDFKLSNRFLNRLVFVNDNHRRQNMRSTHT